MSAPDGSNEIMQPSFEANLEKLQIAVKKLESGELSLEDALKQFEEGVKLSHDCQALLSAAEQKVELLVNISPDGKSQTQGFTPTSTRS